MIVSASYRTDIPAYYGDWFLGRLASGITRVGNPYGGKPYTVALIPAAVDGFVFWTRNARPFLDGLEAVAARGFPFVVQHTITGYPRALEPAAPPVEAAAETFRALATRWGFRTTVWRYDPVLVSDLTPPAWHLARFATLAHALEGATDEAVISFAQIYRKTRRGLDRAARAHGFAWRDPDPDEKRALCASLADIAAGHGMRLTVCAQPEFVAGAAAPARCIDAGRLSDVAGRTIAARRKGNRAGCDCAESRDIGAYDTCPMGCAFCYAVSSQAAARRAVAAHDPAAEMLGMREGAGAGRP